MNKYMSKLFRFIEEKYEKKLLPWIGYIFVLVIFLSILGIFIKNDIVTLVRSLGFTVLLVSVIMIHIALKYGGEYIVAVGSFGGISFGVIIWYLGINFLKMGESSYKYFAIFLIFFMVVSVIAISRKSFSKILDSLLSGIAMIPFLGVGIIIGVFLTIPFGMIWDKLAILGLAIGIILILIYGGRKTYAYFNKEKKEIYSPKGAGIIGVCIGGMLGLSSNQIFDINSVGIPFGLVINLISGAVTGFIVGFLSQKMKKKIDAREEDSVNVNDYSQLFNSKDEEEDEK